jgi:hypothetical protein
MSSDGTGAVGEAATEAEDTDAVGTVAAGRVTADQAELADPWFAPALSTARQDVDGNPDADADDDGTAQSARQAEWFLRTGRAGLMPDSMTVDWDHDGDADPPADRGARIEAAGAPPWAGERADGLASAPPPWETGPWPGPGGLRSAGPGPAGDAQAGSFAQSSTVSGRATGNQVRPGAVGGVPIADQGRWSARTVLTAGLVPLVVPGLVVGILSLRQPSGPAVRKASWLAIAASMVWAVVIILIVAGTSGGSAPGCGSYPAAVHQAYEKALADLENKTPAAVEAADLGAAANLANASAAATGQIGVRTGLFGMADDMAQARADVIAQRPVPVALRQHLAEDGTPSAGSCGA